MIRRSFLAAAAAAVSVALAPLAVALENAAPKPWIHVEVNETGESGQRVHVNLPLSAAEVALELAPAKEIQDGKLKLDGVTVADLRRLWAELKDAGDAEFVSVDSEEQTVRIARQGDRIHISVDQKDEGGDRVRVEVPVDLVDALLSGEGEQLNIRAAVAQLKNQRGDIVRVESKGQSVRIWIDTRS